MENIVDIEKMLLEVFPDLFVEDNCFVSERLGIKKDRFYVLCPCSIGDTLFVLCMLKSYLSQINNTREVSVIVKNAHKDIPSWIDSKWEVICSDELVWGLNLYSIIFSIWKLDNFLYGHFKKKINFLSKGDDYNWVDPDGEINIVTRYSKMLFEKDNCRIDFPNYDVIYASNNEYGVSKKSVVLMPYAQTAPMIPLVFWERLANVLIRKGYDVITNIKDNSEQAIAGTRALCVSIEDMVKVCHDALAVIALRSGMCDVLAFSDAIIFVLNTSEELHNEWDIQEVNNREGIMNFLVNQENIGEVFRQLLLLFDV